MLKKAALCSKKYVKRKIKSENSGEFHCAVWEDGFLYNDCFLARQFMLVLSWCARALR